jgi:hypothetical protein
MFQKELFATGCFLTSMVVLLSLQTADDCSGLVLVPLMTVIVGAQASWPRAIVPCYWFVRTSSQLQCPFVASFVLLGMKLVATVE